jgi:hypothetical protein
MSVSTARAGGWAAAAAAAPAAAAWHAAAARSSGGTGAADWCMCVYHAGRPDGVQREESQRNDERQGQAATRERRLDAAQQPVHSAAARAGVNRRTRRGRRHLCRLPAQHFQGGAWQVGRWQRLASVAG